MLDQMPAAREGRRSRTRAMRPVTCVPLLALVVLSASCGGGASPESGSSSPTRKPAQTASAGPYTTQAAAESYVRSQPEFQQSPPGYVRAERTWRPSATLHVLHATPSGTASYGGDAYYFFVNGAAVGRQRFTKAVTDSAVNDTTFSISYSAYQHGDPHCCPSGGMRTVKFAWDDAKLRLGAVDGRRSAVGQSEPLVA